VVLDGGALDRPNARRFVDHLYDVHLPDGLAVVVIHHPTNRGFITWDEKAKPIHVTPQEGAYR
jgi:hypothetical protein